MTETDQSKEITEAEVASLTQVLRSLPVAEASEPQQAGTKSAIEDFTLNITTTTQNLIKVITGTGAFAGLAASITAWAKDQGDVVLATCIASTALVLAVGLYALAKVMDGDVRGRASAGTAAVEARGLVARSLIDLYGNPGTDQATSGQAASRPSDVQMLLALSAFKRRLKVSTKQGESTVEGARWSPDEKLEIKLTSGDWVEVREDCRVRRRSQLTRRRHQAFDR